MAQIIDYRSLIQAITDFAHRSDLVDNVYSDMFLQVAQNRVSKDILLQNMGNAIQAMEEAMVPVAMAGGVVPVPSDWLAPKDMQVSDGSGDIFTLIFKAAAWIYDAYPQRQPTGLPAYIARDVVAPASFFGSISGGILTVQSVSSGLIQTGMPINDTTNAIPNGVVISGFLSGTQGGVGTYSVNTATTVGSENMTGGGSVFIFGPYPDSNYTLQGTYYSEGQFLSDANPTNWIVSNMPETLHAACMVEVSKFLRDAGGMEFWDKIYNDFLEGDALRDKAERWGASTMQIEIG